MPYKIALTSADGKSVDLHFGHTDTFQILQVDESSGSWEILEQRSIAGPEDGAAAKADCGSSCGTGAPVSGCGGHGHNDTRLEAVIALLHDCRYLLTSRIGPKPSETLRCAGITALEAPADLELAVSKLHVYHLKYAALKKEV
jgi:predicted Fe-Mo cluster-binding NifX family protein